MVTDDDDDDESFPDLTKSNSMSSTRSDTSSKVTATNMIEYALCRLYLYFLKLNSKLILF